MSRRIGVRLAAVALVFIGAACEDDGVASPSTDTASVSTTTTVVDVIGSPIDTVADTTVDPTTSDTTRPTPAPTTPDPTTPPTPPPTSPPTSPAPDPAGDTGLDPGTPSAPPAPMEYADADATVTGQATIVVEGPFPLSLSGGLCSYYESTVYVQAGVVGSDFITVSWVAPSADRDVITDPARISSPQIGWESGGTGGLSYPEETVITFDDTGAIAGSFVAHAVLARPGVTEQIDISGRFTCLPSPFGITGPHNVQLTEARCSQAGVSAGTPTTDAALLTLDPASINDGDAFAVGALSYRFNGVVYTSTWAQIEFSADGVAGRFVAMMIGPGGGPFTVSGAFSCVGAP